jgi:hypothetical protein
MPPRYIPSETSNANCSANGSNIIQGHSIPQNQCSQANSWLSTAIGWPAGPRPWPPAEGEETQGLIASESSIAPRRYEMAQAKPRKPWVSGPSRRDGRPCGPGPGPYSHAKISIKCKFPSKKRNFLLKFLPSIPYNLQAVFKIDYRRNIETLAILVK